MTTTYKDTTFALDEEFLGKFKGKQPEWGPLGYVTYKRTYARPKDDGSTEEYWETTQRVVEGAMAIAKNHLQSQGLPYRQEEWEATAEDMYQRMWDFKWTPPGRGMWVMGTDIVNEGRGAALNNCAFVSTSKLRDGLADPFCFSMDMSMLGVGVGHDTLGAGQVEIKEPQGTIDYLVADSREGWVESVRVLFHAYEHGDAKPIFDYSNVRPKGTPLKIMGGKASGPGPLKDLHRDLEGVLEAHKGSTLNVEGIVDCFNLIGKCVVSGGIRRSAQIMFGSPEDPRYLGLKDPETNQEALMSHRWASNNSVFAKEGMKYDRVAEMTAKNGEPGYEWLLNAQRFGRMKDPRNDKDTRAKGGNPCLEQTLEPYELCCLVETYMPKHHGMRDWQETLGSAFLYAKIVTLVPTHDERTNEVMARNRRIGTSASGITQGFSKFGRRNVLWGMDKGYEIIQGLDKRFSEKFAVPQSIKTTSVKPSGTVSLLPGVTPGIHYPQSEHYIRRIRFEDTSSMLPMLAEAGYHIEDDQYAPHTKVVSFPVKEENFDRSVDQVSMWEQLENAAQVQHYWADNQVSVTINFKPEEAGDIAKALELYETRLKGVSFLPTTDHGYVQAPYEPISSERYKELSEPLKELRLTGNTHEQEDKGCDGETCTI